MFLKRRSAIKPAQRMRTLRRGGSKFRLNRSGQDLIEYALVVALIAFGAAAGMKTIASQINVAFTQIGTKLVTYTS